MKNKEDQIKNQKKLVFKWVPEIAQIINSSKAFSSKFLNLSNILKLKVGNLTIYSLLVHGKDKKGIFKEKHEGGKH